MKLAPFALVSARAFAFSLPIALAACGAAPRTDAAATDDDARTDDVAPVLLNIGIDQLHVARLDLDLDANIVRFTAPAATLPLDRVSIFADEAPPEDLNSAIERCNDLWGNDVTGGDEFVVGQGESLVMSLGASACVTCGFAVICPGHCSALGPGDVPRGDTSTYDTDPSDGADTGSDGGESGGSGSGSGNDGDRSGGDSSSGADSGGSGGSHGGVGQPGGWD
jgi:hypothetical protein